MSAEVDRTGHAANNDKICLGGDLGYPSVGCRSSGGARGASPNLGQQEFDLKAGAQSSEFDDVMRLFAEGTLTTKPTLEVSVRSNRSDGDLESQLRFQNSVQNKEMIVELRSDVRVNGPLLPPALCTGACDLIICAYIWVSEND